MTLNISKQETSWSRSSLKCWVIFSQKKKKIVWVSSSAHILISPFVEQPGFVKYTMQLFKIFNMLSFSLNMNWTKRSLSLVIGYWVELQQSIENFSPEAITFQTYLNRENNTGIAITLTFRKYCSKSWNLFSLCDCYTPCLLSNDSKQNLNY